MEFGYRTIYPRLRILATMRGYDHANTGDDTEYNLGLQSPSPRFQIIGTEATSNVMIDLLTGLMWVRNPAMIIPGDTSGLRIAASQRKGDWLTTTAYAVGDVVRVGYKEAWTTLHEYVEGDVIYNASTLLYYVCPTGHGHTAGTWATDLAAGHWSLIASDSTTKVFYICTTAHTSGTWATDLEANKWAATPWTMGAASSWVQFPDTWATCLAKCEALTYCGFTDWRMPNVNERLSVAEWAAGNNGWYLQGTDGFLAGGLGTYAAWTSTPAVAGSQVYKVNVASGYVNLAGNAEAGPLWTPVCRGPV